MADDPASASNIWMAVLPLISDVGQAEVRMPANGSTAVINIRFQHHAV